MNLSPLSGIRVVQGEQPHALWVGLVGLSGKTREKRGEAWESDEVLLHFYFFDAHGGSEEARSKAIIVCEGFVQKCDRLARDKFDF